MLRKERRPFRRYRKKSRFSLDLNGRRFKAETVDYSADGIGMIIEENPGLSTFDSINLNISSPDIRRSGTIVWLKKTGFGTKVGIHFEDTIKGSLRDFRFSDILLGLQRNGKTGILEVKSYNIVKRVYIQSGNLIFSASNQKADWLGDILLDEGRINREQYNASVEAMKATGKRQGGILVELGYLKAQELASVVQDQVERIILSIFGLTDGEFEFREGPLPTEEVITLRLSAANLIYKGIKALSAERCLAVVCPEDEAVLCFSSDPLDLFQDIRLDDSGKTVLPLITGKKTIAAVMTESGLTSDEALRTIYALLSTRIIDIKEEVTNSDVTSEEVTSEPMVTASQELVSRIEYIYGKLEELGYYGILDIDENASSGEIKKAYYRTAKEYHPDRHFHLPQEMREKLGEIFNYITRAYSNLRDPQKRKEYDKTLTVQ